MMALAMDFIVENDKLYLEIIMTNKNVIIVKIRIPKKKINNN